MRNIEDKTSQMTALESHYGIEIEELLRWMYVDQEYTLTEMADYLNLQRKTVQRWMELAGIHRRKVELSGSIVQS